MKRTPRWWTEPAPTAPKPSRTNQIPDGPPIYRQVCADLGWDPLAAPAQEPDRR